MSNTAPGAQTALVTDLASDVSFTIFTAYNAPKGERRTGTYANLLAELRTPRPKDVPKDQLPLWAPATFKGDHRNAHNIEHVWSVGYDVDVDAPGRADMLRALAGRSGILYPSSSSTTKKPRWRLILRLSRPVTTAEEYKRIWRAVVSELPFAVAVGREASDASRQWYWPREPAEGDYLFEELRGKPVDVDAMLAAEPPVSESDESTELPAEGSRFVSGGNLEDAARLLARHFVSGQRHAMSLEIAGACAWSGLSQKDAATFLCRVAELGPEGNEDAADRKAAIQRTYLLAATGARVTGWPSLEKRIGFLATRVREVLHGSDAWREFVKKCGERARAHAANDDVDEDEWEPRAANDVDESSAKVDANPLGVIFGGLDGEDAPVEYVVDSILPRGSVCMFVAEPYSLKSFAAIDIGISVAHGRPWLGKHATKAGRVIYINYEMHKSEMARRMRLLRDEGGLVGRVTHPDVSLDDAQFWTALEALKPALVIVDTLSAGNPNAEEKDPRFANPLRVAAKLANATGCSFIFVHHTTKDSTASKKSRVRGTGAVFGAVDSCYFFEPSAVKNVSSVECIKMRSGPEPEKFTLKLSDARGLELEKFATSAGQLTRDATPQELEKSIRLRLPGTASDIGGLLGKRPNVITAGLKAMKERGEAIQFERRWRADGPEERKSRVVAAITQNPQLYTAAQVAKAAHVETEDVRKLEQSGVVYKTSSGDEGGYAVARGRG